MESNRIVLIDAPAWYDWLKASPTTRYGTAAGTLLVIAATIALLTKVFGATAISGEAVQILLFAAIVVSSVIGGLGPGLLATVIALLAGAFAGPHLQPAQERILAVEGLLVSLTGGTLRAARRKADDRLAANLNLEQQILEIGDDERRRIGHDLHDGLGQHLTGISLLSESMAQQLQAGRLPNATNVETITHLVSEAVGITRDLAKTLSPVTLERDGFVAAIEELADTSSTLLGIECTGEFLENNLNLDRSRALHLYRIAQEAVNNSVRHGNAKKVTIRVERKGDYLHLSIADDGSGLSQKTVANPGLGLRIMQYRARMLAATLAVERANPAGGTLVTCVCPIS